MGEKLYPALKEQKYFMEEALLEAEKAKELGEVPIGAVVVDSEGQIVGRGYNKNLTEKDPTAHAEIVAIKEACNRLAERYLTGMTLFVTVEPCVMCAGAIVSARIPRVVFGAWEPKTGASGSIYDVLRETRLPHPPVEVIAGVLEDRASALMADFFVGRRD